MNVEASPHGPERNPGIATAEQGLVLLDGPDGVAISMTPEAAAETGRNLIAAAEEAAGQRGSGAQQS
jgi:hypothetical protein